MSQSLLLRGARQLLTLRGDPGFRRGYESGNLAIIEDGSVFIQDGKIKSVGPTRRLENLKETRGAIQIPAQNCVVLPGFVDASMEIGLGIAGNLSRVPAKRPTAADFQARSLSLMRTCLQHGTLNACVRAVSGIGANSSLSVLRQLTRLSNTPVGLTRIWCPDEGTQDFTTPFKRRLAESILLKAGDPRISLAIASDARLSLDARSASTDELESALEQAASPVSVFCRHDLPLAERRLLLRSGAAAVVRAGSVLLDSPTGPCVREWLDEGGALALGSGYDALHEGNFNMQLVLALAVRRLNLTIEEAIVGATINAACAMHIGHQIGSLEPGKRADVVVLNLPDYREIPRRLGVNHVAMAIRNGEIVTNRTKWRVGAA